MGVVNKSGYWTFKAFTAGHGLTTIYLAATFSVNVYRGLSWHTPNRFANPMLKEEPPQSLKPVWFFKWLHHAGSIRKEMLFSLISKIYKDGSDD